MLNRHGVGVLDYAVLHRIVLKCSMHLWVYCIKNLEEMIRKGRFVDNKDEIGL